MKTTLDPATAALIVVWGALLLGFVFGAVSQITRFCIRGAIADWVTFRGPARLISWMLAVGVAAFGVQALIGLELFDANRSILWSSSFLWSSYLAGGALFGFGMILAGGCPQRCLVKAGSGDLKAVITLIVTAIAALMTLRGAFASPRVTLLDAWAIQLPTSQDLGAMLAGDAGPISPGLLRWTVASLLLAGAVWAAWLKRRMLEPGHWLGGTLVGLLVPLAFLLTGYFGFLPEHPQTLEPAWLGTQSNRPEGLSFAAPLAHSLDLLTLWSDVNTTASFGITLALGVLLGSFISATLRGDFLVESFRTPPELTAHLTGSLMMGVGGVTAMGCSIGNGVTGLAMLSAGAILAVAGIVAGAVLALHLQRLQMDRKEAKLHLGKLEA